jgi:hypothetical protein
MSKYAIEKGIPIPCPRRTAWGMPLAEMEVGDSFLARCEDEKNLSYLRSYPGAWGKTHGRRFTTRYMKDANAVRVWRIEDLP